jgi:spermidine synthase
MVFNRKHSQLKAPLRLIIFIMFLLSGFCGLLYQVVWIRLAYASFGIITPVMSVVISVFMLGLLIGTATGGKVIAFFRKHSNHSAMVLYACAESGIGLGAFCVPFLFKCSERYLLGFGGMNSSEYLLVSGVAIAAALLPWCILMGFTYPLVMSFLKEVETEEQSSFSFLYLANVVGAMAGTCITAVVLIELFGFSLTLTIAALCNFIVAALAIFVNIHYGSRNPGAGHAVYSMPSDKISGSANVRESLTIAVLFVTGFCSMCMEVIWIRGFTPVVKTTIYSYAMLLTVYLFATWAGSCLYRYHLKTGAVYTAERLIGVIALFSFLPVVMNDPRFGANIPNTLISIFPFCAVLGYLTPKLIDFYGRGDPSSAGRAYAVNIAGCIIGPLIASYFFLPVLGVKVSLIVLSLPFLTGFLFLSRGSLLNKPGTMAIAALSLLLLGRSIFISDSYEEAWAGAPGVEIRRDHTATVISMGQGFEKKLLVNGMGITSLTPITKLMAHLPLVFCGNEVKSALAICLGMGTTFRSMMSWNIATTAVELCPSVPQAMGYYFADADSLRKNPKATIVVDDGRRFLLRTDGKFDVITIDPPPPVEAAGSSLLYSKEFYTLAKQRLAQGGILQQWYPQGERLILQAVARSLAGSFPHVRVFGSIEGWGFHFLASMEPIPIQSAAKMVSKMPGSAVHDLMEWFDTSDPVAIIAGMLSREIPLSNVLNPDTSVIITDAHPYNEYFILRRIAGGTLRFR